MLTEDWLPACDADHVAVLFQSSVPFHIRVLDNLKQPWYTPFHLLMCFVLSKFSAKTWELPKFLKFPKFSGNSGKLSTVPSFSFNRRDRKNTESADQLHRLMAAWEETLKFADILILNMIDSFAASFAS